MNYITTIVISAFLLFACDDKENKDPVAESKHLNTPPPPPQDASRYNISWLDSSKVAYQIDTLLSHKGRAFKCDSAIAIDYTGFRGEHFFMPVNQKGQWINTIEKRKKLSERQLQLVHAVFGNKKSFEHPLFVSCYEPRLAIVYFKDNKVIAQSAICLGCAKLESSATLGDGENYSSFNEQALGQLEKLCSDLQFSNCGHRITGKP